ncbi:hypothetical protein TEA_020256 [Camellia sinensis var. sinensis]|uniref:Elongator complex protein 6 n=1 Tax=Camellia sinensis var. sinensis TaxID=542762 RepID=A0A4S4F1I5_CAMSN|nr:hypothetical protein TEA_020256 [Camellia sinensis var. sinensis]
MDRSLNLLDEALGLDNGDSNPSETRLLLLIEDCVETSAYFVLHHLIKRSLSPHSSALVGCNLVVQRDNKRFLFLDMLTLECPGEPQGCNLVVQRDNKRFLFLDMLTLECPGEPQKAVEVSVLTGGTRSITIMIDDISLMEVAANGSSNHVLDFLHYCQTLTTEFGCSLVFLNHKDIYSSMERPTLILQMEYLAEVIIRAEPLATGLAADVHGQSQRNSNNVKMGKNRRGGSSVSGYRKDEYNWRYDRMNLQMIVVIDEEDDGEEADLELKSLIGEGNGSGGDEVGVRKRTLARKLGDDFDQVVTENGLGKRKASPVKNLSDGSEMAVSQIQS